MHHPGLNAEIARLAHAEALRGARHAYHLQREEPVPAEDRPATAVARFASLLLPELRLALPTPAPVPRPE